MADLTELPTTITAGDSYVITLSLSDYPATAGWSLAYAVAGTSVDSWTSTASGAAHVLTLTAIDTAALSAGTYQTRLRASRSGAVETIATGVVTVAADLFAAAPGEYTSEWEALKAAAHTALKTLMDGGGVQMVTILGRQTMFRSPDDCLRVIARCDHEIAKARNNGKRGMMSFMSSGPSPDRAWS